MHHEVVAQKRAFIVFADGSPIKHRNRFMFGRVKVKGACLSQGGLVAIRWRQFVDEVVASAKEHEPIPLSLMSGSICLAEGVRQPVEKHVLPAMCMGQQLHIYFHPWRLRAESWQDETVCFAQTFQIAIDGGIGKRLRRGRANRTVVFPWRRNAPQTVESDVGMVLDGRGAEAERQHSIGWRKCCSMCCVLSIIGASIVLGSVLSVLCSVQPIVRSRSKWIQVLARWECHSIQHATGSTIAAGSVVASPKHGGG